MESGNPDQEKKGLKIAEGTVTENCKYCDIRTFEL